MIYILFCIYDKVGQTYGTPTPFVNRASAQRWFRRVVSTNELAEPTDFELYELGTFDVSSGALTVLGGGKPLFVEKGVITDET